MLMFALVDFFQNGSVHLYGDFREAQIAMKTDFAQKQFEMMKDGYTFGKSYCYNLGDRSAQLFADEQLCGHWWQIVNVDFPDNLRRKRKLDLYAIVKMLHDDDVIICNSKAEAQAQMEKLFNEKKAEFLAANEVINEELEDGYASVSPQKSFDIHAWTIMKAEWIRR